MAYPLHGLATIYREQNLSELAEQMYRRSLSIREKELLPSHPDLGDTLQEYAILLRSLGRETEAEQLESRITSKSQS